MIDLRPFARKFRLGYQTLNAIFANAMEIYDLLRLEHHPVTGEHRTRKIAIASATYHYNATFARWDRVGGIGPLPAVGARSAAGTCSLLFSSAIGSTPSDYDVQLTAEGLPADAVIPNYRSKLTTGIVVTLRGGIENVLLDGNFSIEIKQQV